MPAGVPRPLSTHTERHREEAVRCARGCALTGAPPSLSSACRAVNSESKLNVTVLEAVSIDDLDPEVRPAARRT